MRRLLEDDADLAGSRPFLVVIALAVWLSLLVGSFYNDDSPIQFRCHQGNAYTTAGLLERGLRLEGDCRLVWVGL